MAITLTSSRQKYSMNLQEFEPTISQIVSESNHEPKESGKSKVLTSWRSKLKSEPNSLPTYRIDGIVREVRKRLK
jgi:hypothetical protein